jgi:hypothetical protein
VAIDGDVITYDESISVDDLGTTVVSVAVAKDGMI